MTPNLAFVQVQWNHYTRGIRLWLPLFLLWIPLLMLSPLILIVLLAVCLAGRIHPGKAIAALWAIACSLPGTDVRVVSDGARVTVKVL